MIHLVGKITDLHEPRHIGTGFLVDGGLACASCYHTVANSEHVFQLPFEGRRRNMSKPWQLGRRDIAISALSPGSESGGLRFATSVDVTPGDQVIVWAFDIDVQAIVELRARVVRYSHSADATSIDLDLAGKAGYSGAPVIAAGEVIALVSRQCTVPGGLGVRCDLVPHP